jgi:BirA family transcriptional regulator, biotin operon repressor / biotin---[acetyl-CoA-carboxylase] ligase
MGFSWLNKYNLLIFEEIDSTNSEALRIAKKSPPTDLVILGKKQTGGRGRNGKFWESLEGNLHASILLKLQNKIISAPQLSFVIANTLYEIITELCQDITLLNQIKLKWPNDLLIRDKKVAGILLESINIGNIQYIVIGFGINIEHYPQYLNRPITSLKNENIDFSNINNLLNLLIKRFDILYTNWQKEGFYTTRELWLKHAYKLNSTITIDDGKNKVSGIFKTIDEEGQLVLETKNSQTLHFADGEVVW